MGTQSPSKKWIHLKANIRVQNWGCHLLDPPLVWESVRPGHFEQAAPDGKDCRKLGRGLDNVDI